MKKIVKCQHCAGEIKSNDDLVTANFIVFIAPYHSHCYAQGLKSEKTFLLGNHPVNGFSGNYTAIVSLIAVLLLLFIAPELKVLAIFPLVPIIFRLLSFVLYERHLM